MSSIFLAASVDSPSGSKEQECEPLRSAKSNPIADEFLPSTGLESLVIRTSGQWRLSEHQKRQAAAMYESGLSLGKVAIQFAVSRQSMWDVLRRRTTLRDRIAALPRKPPTTVRLKRLKALRRYRARAKRITRAQILTVMERDKVCRVCAKPGTDIDHILEVSRGGQTELFNLQLLCRTCHRQKSGKALRKGV